MYLRIEQMPARQLVGKRKRMSFANNQAKELWRSFMPVRTEIEHRAGEELFSLELYDDLLHFVNFNPAAEFEKWAAIEVLKKGFIPDGTERLELPAGLYAVFLHKGPASEGPRTYRYIFGTWLPHSAYELDHRPHFALMGEKYKNNDPDSEEEIWIPVKVR